MVRRSKCSAQGCSYDRTGMYKKDKAWRVLHPFPEDIAMSLVWLRACGNLNLLKKSIKSLLDGYYICTAHFEFKDYKSLRHLEHTAVPKIFSHAGPIPHEMILEFAIRNNVEKYLNPRPEAIVPLVTAICDHNYYISEVTDLGTTHGGQESVITSKLVNNIVEDSIIFVQPNIDGSSPGNPDEASTLQEELQTMECQEVSNWLQISDDIDCAEIVMNPEEIDTTSTAKWKHCKKYQRKKNSLNNQQDPVEKHLEYMKIKKELTVNLSYINVPNQSTVAESGDPMSRLVNVDESRSLMTQEYVSSVLSALDTDLSYSVFDREKMKPVEVAVTAPLSPRQREPDSLSPGSIIEAEGNKPTKSVGIIRVPTTAISSTIPRYQVVEQRSSSPPPLIPFKRQSELRFEHPRNTSAEFRVENTSTPISQLRIENPRTVRTDVPMTVDVSNEVTMDMELDEHPPEEPARWQNLPDNLCRVCAKTCASLVYVFSDKGQTLHLADLVHTHLPIMITPDDLLPTHICTSCITRLQAADSLVRSCMEADSTLRGLLNLTPNTQTQPSESNSYDNDDNGYEDNIFIQDVDEADSTPKRPQETDKNNDFSNLLSQDDVSLINKMKGDGLKVTLVRVPNLNDLPEEKKHQRVLQVLRSMNASKSAKRKPLGTISLRSDPPNRETANISPVDNALQDITAGSALRDTETETLTIPDQPSKPKAEPEAELEANPPVGDLSTIPADPSTSSPNSSKAAGFAPNISISADVPSLLRNELLDGINYAIKQGHVAKTGSIIKLNCKQDDTASSPASVYVYVRNKDSQANSQQIPRKILDLDILHEHQQRVQKLKEKKAAAKVAKHQASMVRRRSRLREKRRLISERRALTCEECGLLFKTKKDVAEHRMEHLKCRYCDKQFTKKPSLVEHERVHTKEKPFICDQCGRPFRTRAQMVQHAQRHNTDTPYMCQVCGQQFAVRNTYMAHVNRHSAEAPYLCEMCGKCFKVQVALRLHRLTHRSFNCNVCDKVFSYRAYQIHKKSHAGDESKYPCTYCNKKFLTVHRLKIHMLIHEATYPFSCSVCKRSFKRMTHLQAHRTRHTSDQLEGIAFFCCAICQAQFEQPSQLSQHFKTHTEEERQALRAYKCDTCSKCFSIERELRSHELRHAGKQTFSCGTCDRAFDTKKEFDDHSDTHTEEKPFACEVCGKRFRALINLNNHHQIHLSFKPYPCQSCPKAFKTINGLNQHKVVHSDVRKHTCSICSMGFKRRDAMKNHERTHFAERPYACSVCGRAFKVKADCSTHLKRHREAGIEGTIMESCYSCPVCSATFTLKVELSTHVQNAHDLEVAVLDKDDNLVLVPEVEIF